MILHLCRRTFYGGYTRVPVCGVAIRHACAVKVAKFAIPHLDGDLSAVVVLTRTQGEMSGGGPGCPGHSLTATGTTSVTWQRSVHTFEVQPVFAPPCFKRSRNAPLSNPLVTLTSYCRARGCSGRGGVAVDPLPRAAQDLSVRASSLPGSGSARNSHATVGGDETSTRRCLRAEPELDAAVVRG